MINISIHLTSALIAAVIGYYSYPYLLHRRLARRIDKNIDHLLDDMYGMGDAGDLT